MRGMIYVALLAFLSPSATAGPSNTQPTSQPTTTQSTSTRIGKYYGLLRTEFMWTPDDRIVLITNEAKGLIAKVKAAAEEEKQALEPQLAAAVWRRDSDRKHQKEIQRRERSGEIVRGRNGLPDAGSGSAYDQWRMLREYQILVRNQDRHMENPRGRAWTPKQIQEARKRLSLLKTVTSPGYRMVPPPDVWTPLSPREQELLSRVGITLKEFTATIQSLGWTEETFVALGQQVEADRIPVDSVIGKLRAEIERRVKPTASRPASSSR